MTYLGVSQLVIYLKVHFQLKLINKLLLLLITASCHHVQTWARDIDFVRTGNILPTLR